MFAKFSPTTKAYSDDRNEEILYLKWDLQRFLEPGDTRLLSNSLKTQIARLAACLGKSRNMPDALIDCGQGLELLADTTTQINQSIDELDRNALSGAHSPTPREKLVKMELSQLIGRMGHMTTLLTAVADKR